MQLVLNYILHKHQSAIPGTDGPPFPNNVGRLVACDSYSNGTGNSPEVCYDEVFNFFVEFDWQRIGEEALKYVPKDSPFREYVDTFVNDTEILSEVAQIRQQEYLFDLPFYYVGK